MSKKPQPADYLFWAIKQQTGNSLRNLILIHLANINGEGGCYPSHQTIADRCGCKRNAVIRHLKILEGDGWITSKHRTREGMQTSNEYTINLDKSGVSLEYSGCIPKIQGVYSKDTGGGILEIHETPIIKHPVKHPIKHTPLPPSDFDRFYAAYPKKTGRREAERAWKKLNPLPALISRIMLDIAQRVELGAWCTGKGKQYIPGPAPYLNQCRWEDEIIPRPEFRAPVDFSKLSAESVDLSEGL